MALELANGRWDFLQEVATKHEGQNLGIAFGTGSVKQDMCQSSGGNRLHGSHGVDVPG